MKKLSFENAKQIQLEHPETFRRPSEKYLDNLKPGDKVKICYKKERFWVDIKLIEENNIIGTVDNELVLSELKYKDLIKFHKDNVYSIWHGIN